MKLNFRILLTLAMLGMVGLVKAQGSLCSNIEPFCAGDQRLVFANSNEENTDVDVAEEGPDYGCLSEQPFPSWFFMQIEKPGDLKFTLAQNTQADFSGADLDVDFIVWGPFERTDDFCSYDNLTEENQVGCSYSEAATETMTINNAQANAIYIVLITNFERLPGFISLQQQNPNAAGQGSTDCSILGNALGDDIAVCGEQEYVLDGTSDEASAYAWYERLEGENEYTEIVGEEGPTLTVTQSGDYRLILTDVLGDNSEADDVTVTFYDNPEIGVAGDLYSCDSSGTVDLTENDDDFIASQGSGFSVRYYETQVAAEEDTRISSPATFNFSGEQSIYARVENDETGCLSEIGSFELLAYDFPQLNLPESAALCVSEEGNLVNDLVLGADVGAQFSYEWRAGSTILGNSAILTLTEDPQVTFLELILTSLETGCETNFQVNLEQVYVPENLSVNISGSGFGDGYTLEPMLEASRDNPFAEYEYSLDEGDWQAAPFRNVSAGNHTIRGREVNGCGPTLSFQIYLVGYPKYFSPNGDGINDYWNVLNDAQGSIRRLYVFDRYGKLIKQLDPRNGKGWDGTYNGKQLPADDYWFRVEVQDVKTGERQEYMANFSLIR